MNIIIKHEERVKYMAALVQEVKPGSSLTNVLCVGDEIVTINDIDVSSWNSVASDILKCSNYTAPTHMTKNRKLMITRFQ